MVCRTFRTPRFPLLLMTVPSFCIEKISPINETNCYYLYWWCGQGCDVRFPRPTSNTDLTSLLLTSSHALHSHEGRSANNGATETTLNHVTCKQIWQALCMYVVWQSIFVVCIYSKSRIPVSSVSWCHTGPLLRDLCQTPFSLDFTPAAHIIGPEAEYNDTNHC